jgi:hypothetical protein
MSDAKIVLAFPLYRQVPVSWFFNYLQLDKTHVAAHVGTEAMYVPLAMQTLIDLAYEHCPDFDRIVVIEHDMEFPLNAIERIANYGPEHDIVGSVYFKHDAPHHVMAWMKVEPPKYSPLTADVVQTMVETPALYEVDAVALGFTSISRRVIDEWDPSVPMWDPIPPLVGHDLHFCNEAKKQGFGIYLDSGIGCGHLTLMPIGYAHSQAALRADPTLQTWEEARANGTLPAANKGELSFQIAQA